MNAFDTLLPRPVSARSTGGTCRVENPAALTDVSTVVIDPAALPHPGAYRLSITPGGVRATAGDAAGAFHATQSLRQLLGPDTFRAADIHGADFQSGDWLLPCGEVVDHPRFRWRGVLLDVARHFQPKAAVLRFIDLMAAHKLNVLHLHLTDDQGWRIEVPAYPRLTEIGAWRKGSWRGRQADGDPTHDGRPHGGFYTTRDLREIVAYARARHITVVPEVDVPGHSQAAIAAYPELGAAGTPVDVWHAWGVSEHVLAPTPHVIDFYRTVLDHVVDVFDAPVVCLGGDEVPTKQWQDSQAADLGLDSVDAIPGWFLRTLSRHLAGHGRRTLGWDDIMDHAVMDPEGLAPGVIIGSWRGEEAGIAAAAAGHDVVMCPEQHVYLDHRQSDHPDEPTPVGYLHTVDDVYAYDPIPDGMPDDAQHHVLGAQAQIWTEHLDTPRRVDYAAFPRLAAFAEVVWTPKARRDPTGFAARLTEHHLPRLDALGVEYRGPGGPLPWQTRPGVPGRQH